MAWQHDPEEDEGAGVDLSTLAAMSEYSSTAGGTQRSEPSVLLGPTAEHPMSHFDAPKPVRDELYWYALEQATQDPHPPESDLPPAEVAAMHMIADDGEEPRDTDDARPARIADARVSTIMTRDVQSVAPDAPLSEVRELLSLFALHHVPVTEGERLVGMISSNDLLQLRIEAAPLAWRSAADYAPKSMTRLAGPALRFVAILLALLVVGVTAIGFAYRPNTKIPADAAGTHVVVAYADGRGTWRDAGIG